MVYKYFIYFALAAYIFSGLVCWRFLARHISAKADFWWQNFVVISTSWVIIFIWPIWLIFEAEMDNEETIMSSLAWTIYK